MKAKVEKYKNSADFGLALGLTEFEIKLIKQKKKIIEKLKKAREASGISQAALALMVDTKQPAIARMESGQVSEVSLDFLCKVAMALDVTVIIKPDAA